MTDPDLVYRAEQALLGAMTQRPRQIAALNVTPGHFADPTHQAIAASLTGMAGEDKGFLGRIRGFFARHSRATRQAGAYLEGLPAHCPDPAHIGAYYQMVSAAKAERDAAVVEVAHELSVGTQLLTVASERLASMNAKRDKSTNLPADVAKLARALEGKTRQLLEGLQPQAPAATARQQEARPQNQPASGSVPQSQPAQGQTPPAPAPTANGSAPQPGTVPGQAQPATALSAAANGASSGEQQAEPAARPDGTRQNMRREDLQDSILSCLMTNPDEARRVVAWLHPDVFEGPRRELYALIGDFVRNRAAIDPLTLAWAVQQRDETRPRDGALPDGDGWLRPDFVLGLGALCAAPGTAEVLGGPLLADHVYRTTAGEGWAQAGEYRLGAHASGESLQPAGEQPVVEAIQAAEPGAARKTGAPGQKKAPPRPAESSKRGEQRRATTRQREPETAPAGQARPALIEPVPGGPSPRGPVPGM